MADTLVEQLEAACDTGAWQSIQLPSGRMILVCPQEGFDTLRYVLNDERFLEGLKQAEDDWKNGRGKVYGPGELPGADEDEEI